jgi:hypothetical protein
VLTGYAALYRLFLDLEVTIHHQIAEFDEVVTRKPYRATHRGTFLDTAATGRVVDSRERHPQAADGQYVECWVRAVAFLSSQDYCSPGELIEADPEYRSCGPELGHLGRLPRLERVIRLAVAQTCSPSRVCRFETNV